MGADKSRLLIDGVPQARRIADALMAAGLPVSVLGREPLQGCRLVPDREELAGPVAALANLEPSAELVFVCSCDLPLFDGRIVGVLREKLGDHEAAVPVVAGWRQPLCALYRRQAWDRLGQVEATGRGCAMRWLDFLDVVLVSEEELWAAGVDPRAAQGANTRKELEAMLGPSEGP